MAKDLNGNQDPPEPEGRLRRRVAGEPPLPLLREGRRRRGLPRGRRQLPRHRRRRDRPRPRPPRLPEAGRRPGHGPADRRHRAEPQGRHRRRDPRVHRHVPGHGQDRARRGLRRDRRLVRDAGQGREVATPAASRRCSTDQLNGGHRDGAARPAPTRGRPGALPEHAARSCRSPRAHAERTHLLPADRRAHLRPGGAEVLGRARSTRRSSASSRSATAAACASSTATASRPCSRCSTTKHDGDVRS